MTETKLLPCPFCGGRASLSEAGFGDPEWKYFTCNFCASSSGASANEELAIAAWNHRTVFAPGSVEEGLLEALKAFNGPLSMHVMHDEKKVYCSICNARRAIAAAEKMKAGAA